MEVFPQNYASKHKYKSYVVAYTSCCNYNTYKFSANSQVAIISNDVVDKIRWVYVIEESKSL